MPDRFAEQARAERAFEDYFAARAANADFPPLDPAALVTPRRRRWRPAAIGAVAAVAVIAVATAVIVPLMRAGSVAPEVVPAAPASGRAVPGVWHDTAPIPIGQRYHAVSVWVNDAFFILGGISHCGLDAQGNPIGAGNPTDAPTDASCSLSLPSPGESLRDGARYDPVADTWTRLADAPVPIGGGQGVVAGNAVYVLAERADQYSAQPVLRYDTVTNTWSELPQPSDPEDKEVQQLLTWGGEVYAHTKLRGCRDRDRDCHAIDRWDSAANSWRQYSLATSALASSQVQLAGTEDGCVSLYRATGSAALSAAAFREGSWRQLPDPPFTNPRWMGTSGGVVVVETRDITYTLDLNEGAWRQLLDPPTTGGLAGSDQLFSPRFADGTHVVVDGQLYQPASTQWTMVPPLPNRAWGLGAFASNGTQLLACFVGPTGSMNDCHLLVLGDPVPADRPVAVNEWISIADAPLAPRTDALTAWVGEEFLVLGGRACAGSVGDCETQTPATDGAAYDPNTNRWRTVAPPPAPLDASASWVVLDQRLYVIPADQSGFWTYDPEGDSWRELPASGRSGQHPPQLVTTGDGMLALAEWPQADTYFDTAAGLWTDLPSDTYPNGDYPDGALRQAVFTGKELLIGEPDGAGASVLKFTVFDSDGGHLPPTAPSTVVLEPIEGHGELVVNDQATAVLAPANSDTAAGRYRFGGGQTWEPVPTPGASPGPLQPGLVSGSFVSLRGHLFDPEDRLWRYLPALPDGSSAAVQAAGPGSVLSCFTRIDSDRLGGKCYLLRP